MDNKNNKTIKSNENKVKLLLKKNKDSSNNNNNINKSKISRTVLLTLMGLIIISGIVLFYFVFYKNDTTETYKVGYSYTPKDITNIDINPPVDVKLENIDKCIEACELNGNCSGVTFNKDTYKCKGYKNGMLVKTTPNMYSWEKSRDKKSKVSQMILLTNTYQQTKIDSGRMAFPYTVYDLNFSLRFFNCLSKDATAISAPSSNDLHCFFTIKLSPGTLTLASKILFCLSLVFSTFKKTSDLITLS